MSYVALFLAIAAGAAVIGFVPAYLIARRPIVNPLGSPPCDRCAMDTGKPWLWQQARTRWLCDGCDAEVTALLLDGMREAAAQREVLLRLRAGGQRRDR